MLPDGYFLIFTQNTLFGELFKNDLYTHPQTLWWGTNILDLYSQSKSHRSRRNNFAASWSLSLILLLLSVVKIWPVIVRNLQFFNISWCLWENSGSNYWEYHKFVTSIRYLWPVGRAIHFLQKITFFIIYYFDSNSDGAYFPQSTLFKQGPSILNEIFIFSNC